MRLRSFLFPLLFFFFPIFAWAGEVQDPEIQFNFLSAVWVFLNSPLGITMVIAILGWITSMVFVRRPKWKKYVDQYRPLLIQAVKYAEKKIPDDSTGGAAKLDAALKYILQVNSKLDQKAAKEALTQIHAEAEAAGNLSESDPSTPHG